jgi:hypothetical protein
MALELNTEKMNSPSVELNKTFTHTITNYYFDNLSQSKVIKKFKDGRVFSHFIELWLEINFPIIHVEGCKIYDHIDKNNENIKYDQKTFTSYGCSFMPSNMKGKGRKFDKEIFEKKANDLIYIIVSNVNFPEIKVKFVNGSELASHYPTGDIPLKDFDKFFN